MLYSYYSTKICLRSNLYFFYLNTKGSIYHIFKRQFIANSPQNFSIYTNNYFLSKQTENLKKIISLPFDHSFYNLYKERRIRFPIIHPTTKYLNSQILNNISLNTPYQLNQHINRNNSLYNVTKLSSNNTLIIDNSSNNVKETYFKSKNESLKLPNYTIKNKGLNTETYSKKRIISRIIKDYMVLSKHKLSIWVSLSTLPGLLLANSVTLPTLLSVSIGTFLSSASAASLNHSIEKYQDSRMFRTKNRPVASGRISSKHASIFAITTGLSGTSLLCFGACPISAIIAAFNIGIYAYLYTPMKIRTPYNTHLGSISGSLPVLIGCAAAGHSILAPESLLLFSIQTLWQFPHFYALAWLHKDDYKKAGFKMFPIYDDTGKETADRCKRYMFALLALPMFSSYFGVTSWMFALDSLVPNLATLTFLYVFRSNPTKKNIRKFFLFQLWQLMCLLALAVYHCRSMLHMKSFKSIYEDKIDFDESIEYIQPQKNLFDDLRAYLIGNCPQVLFEDFSQARSISTTKK